MKTSVTCAALLLFVSTIAAQDIQYFPNQVFSRDQRLNDIYAKSYAGSLKALDEPSLFEKGESNTRAYRFLWLRSFNPAVVIRLNVNEDGTSLVTTKIATDRLAQTYKTETKTITKEEAERFLSRVEGLGLKDLPAHEEVLGVDGAEWVAESVEEGKYQVVDRWSPKKGPVRAFGLLMLKLAKLRLDDREIY